MPGHYTNTSSIVANSTIVAATLRGLIDDLDDAIYDVDTQNVLAMPSGSISAYAGSSAPVGWLLCYGQAISRSAYADLFAVIGTQYGVGDGSSTFNVPDLRGRTVIALDNLGGGAAADRVSGVTTLGASGGAQTHTLLIGEIPAHNHSNIYSVSGNNPLPGHAASNPIWANNGDNARSNSYNMPSNGGGGAHNNMQPYIALSYIIKT